jgi:DNA helicase-2/ATP-dependent DNA helicase PcrA
LSDWNLIVGPPGTGKTTKLLSIVDGLLSEGRPSRNIAFVAFTRKAAHEAKGRAIEKFKLTDEDLPWWSTLHSLAFRQLGIGRNEIMGIRDYLAIASRLGLSLTVRGIAEDGTITGLSKGDRLLFMENQARAMMQPLKQYWESRPDEDIYWYELEQVHDTIREYKRANGKRDFTDVIEQFIEVGSQPEAGVLVVDEAQDLSPLQWRMVEKLADGAEQVYIAGDDDQAIFRWAGADVERFIGMDGFRVVLPRSYRVPARVQLVADMVISRCKSRIPKSWLPRDVPGDVQHHVSLDEIDMAKGTWLLLARNSFILDTYNDHCIRQGYVFESSIGSPISGKGREAIVAWDKLLHGNSIPIQQARACYEQMSVREKVAYGAKSKLDRAPDNLEVNFHDLERDYGLLTDAPWTEAFDKMPSTEKQYFLAAMQRGEKLTSTPRIKISTIHSVKGGEADHVVVIPDMAARTFREFQDNPDDEHRVWYVAVTRARESLHIMQPQTNYCYDL